MPNPKASNVVSGKPVASGGVLAAPLGSTLPDDAATAVDAAFVALGYVSEDGLTKGESRDVNEIKEWGGKTVKKSQTGFEVTFQFQFLEYLNADAAKQIYGDGAVTLVPATATAGSQINVSVLGDPAPHKVWVFDMQDGDARLRIVVPDGQITETGDTAFTAGDGAVRDVTITAYPDEDGVVYFEFSDDGVFTGAGTTATASASKSAA